MRSGAPLALLLAAFSAAPVAAEQAPDPLGQAREAFEAERFEQARSLLKPLAADGQSEALFWLGRVALAQERLDEALDLLEKAVERDGESSRKHYWLGRAQHLKTEKVGKLLKMKWAKRMRGSFERAHELEPEWIEPHYSLVRFHREAPGIVGGDRESAWTHAREVARMDSARGEPILADMHREDGDHAKAAEAYLRAIAAAPEARQLRYALAITLADAGRSEESFATIDELQAESEDDPVVIYLVGRTAAISGQRLEKGRSALERYLGLEHRDGMPTPASAHWRLGNIAEHAGDRQSAKASYKRALELEPDLEQAKKSLKGLR